MMSRVGNTTNLSTQLRQDTNINSSISRNAKIESKRRDSQLRYSKNSELLNTVHSKFEILAPNSSNSRYEEVNKYGSVGIKSIAFDRSKNTRFSLLTDALGSPLFQSSKFNRASIANSDAPLLSNSKGEVKKSFYISSKFKHNKKSKTKNVKLFQKRNLEQLFGNK